jgi:hypothetical protein
MSWSSNRGKLQSSRACELSVFFFHLCGVSGSKNMEKGFDPGVVGHSALDALAQPLLEVSFVCLYGGKLVKSYRRRCKREVYSW